MNYDNLLKDKDAQELTESNILKKVSDLIITVPQTLVKLILIIK